MTHYNPDKTDALARTLDTLNTTYKPHHTGWQPIHCVNTDAHPYGDRNPSASINLPLGKYFCHGCDLHGDAYDVAHTALGWTPETLNQQLSMDPNAKEPEWLF